MTKINITDSMIYEIAPNDTTYKRGLQYFNQGRVCNFINSTDSGVISALVEGREDYNVIISYSNDHISSYNCSCPSYSSYDSACKHIVATLKHSQRELGRKTNILNYQAKNESIDYLASYFSSKFENDEKELLKLELTIYIDFFNRDIEKNVELKIGSERMYVIKDIKDFLYNIDTKNIDFGKNFAYDPFVHFFNETDTNILNLLKELLSHEESIKGYSFYKNIISSFKGKRVALSDPFLNRLFDMLKNNYINIVTPEKNNLTVKILEENLPLELNISMENSLVCLSILGTKSILPLTSDFNYILSESEIYKLSSANKKYLEPFYNNLFKGNLKNEVKLPFSQMERFSSEVLPFLSNICTVQIDEDIEKIISKEDVAIKIYLDKYFDGISAKIDFIYGDEVIPAFGNNKSRTTEKIIIRNIQQERKCIAYFEDFNFKVEKEQIYLLNENMIYDFLLVAVPKLSDICEIYYSDSLKNMKISRSYSISGGIKLNSNNMLEFSFNLDGLDKHELNSVIKALKEKKKYYKLKSGAFLPLNNSQLEYIGELVEKLSISGTDLDGRNILLPAYRAMYIDSLLKDSSIYTIEKNSAFKQMVQSIKEPQDMDFDVPSSLKSILRDYQKTGFKWLNTLYHYGFGGILADDMGLGKTVQVLSFVLSKINTESNPSLVIAPTSLIYNWQDEIKKFTPSLRVCVISGSQSERAEQIKELNNSDIIVTSYALIRRDIELYKNFEFSYCFIDEAQHIKNPNTVNAKSVKLLKAKGYFALTGTPIENSLTELWSIFDFIMPGYLLSHNNFIKKFENPIVKSSDEQALKDLSRHISPFILRRMKKDVLKELPEKIEGKYLADLTTEQKKIYIHYLEKAKAELSEELRTSGFERSQIKILSILTRLRQICCHPSLFIENYNGESGKLDLLLELLDDAISGGHRILIFSQFTSMLKIISEELVKRKIEYFYLDGSTKAIDRGEMVKKFNDGSGDVFLISLKAGGTGLNLTGADMVIHYDPWWNPAVEDQASDRAYRIGQDKVVQVLKLITKGTIEEKIYELQQKKRMLIDSVIQPGETFINKLTEREILDIFEV